MEERVDLSTGVSNPPLTAGIQRVGHINIGIVFCYSPDHDLAASDQPLTADQLFDHRNIVMADATHHFLRAMPATCLTVSHA